MPFLQSVRFALAAIIAGMTFSSSLEASSADATLLEPGLWRFEQAEFAISEFGRPDEGAQWRQVKLPERWSRTVPEHYGTVWYRLRIDLSHAPGAPYAIFIPNRRGFDLDAWVNGELFGRERGWTAMGGYWQSPIYFTIPPVLLKVGRNTLEIAIRGDANSGAGLGRVTFGEARRVEQVYRAGTFLQTTVATAQILTVGVLGTLALALWMARRREPLALWFGLAMLSWVAFVSINRWTLGTDIGPLREVIQFLTWILPLSSASACLIAAGRRAPLLHALLWGSLAAGLALIVAQGYPHALVWNLWPAVYTVLPLAFVAWIFATQRDRLGWSWYVFAACAVLAVGFPAHDWLRNEGILDLDRPSLRYLQAIDLVIGVGALMLERYLQATRVLELTTAELERRVAEKTREIEEHARREQALREAQALARERERILADMHDGLGSSLVALTRLAESEQVSRDELARRARDALQDLRIAIDALQSYEGDLATVLGSLRERLAAPLESAGVRLAWDIGELPAVERLPPSTVLDLQRIVLEAATNALRHAGARYLRVSAAHNPASGRILIAIEDDGRGFDAGVGTLGHGLRSMRRRAERLGGVLDIRTGLGMGTRIRLELPAAGAVARAAG